MTNYFLNLTEYMNGSKSPVSINVHKITKISNATLNGSPVSIIYLSDGSRTTVLETREEIMKKIEEI